MAHGAYGGPVGALDGPGHEVVAPAHVRRENRRDGSLQAASSVTAVHPFQYGKADLSDAPVDSSGPNFTSIALDGQLAERHIEHCLTRPRRSRTNGKAERSNRTQAEGFLSGPPIPLRDGLAHPPGALGPRLQLLPAPHRGRRPARITRTQPHTNRHLMKHNSWTLVPGRFPEPTVE